ncbi:vitellogenin-6-like isoform X1 [Haemaphysalis longicornis]
MKLVVAVGALLLSAWTVTGFDNGKEYVYSYEGRIQTINPEQPLHSNGFAFRSKLAMQPKGDLTFFKISDLEVDMFHGQTIDLKTHTFNFRPHEELSNQLERPFAGEYKEGKFEHAELGKGEPMWSHNIKRAILSLFQLDLSKRSQINPQGSEFSVAEDGIHGFCETTYVVTEHEDRLEVTKMKNLEKCDNQPFHVTGTLKGRPCVGCKSQRWVPLTMTSEVKYKLKGNRQNYVISCACGTSDQLFAPYGDGKVFNVQINQTATLLETHDSGAEITLPDSDSYRRLAHKFPETDGPVTGQDLHGSNNYVHEFGLTGSTETFIEGLKRLAGIEYSDEDFKNMRDKLPSPSMLFLQLFSNMLTFTYGEISEIYNQHVLNAPNGAKQHIRNAFLDLLAAAGNNPHVAFALQLIKAGQLSTDEADRLLLKLPGNLKEHSVGVVTELASVCHSEFVTANEPLRSTCMLTLSGLVGGAKCKRSTNLLEADSGLCSPHIVELFFNYSVTPADVKGKAEQRVVYYINVAGNLATAGAVRYLQRFVDPQQHQSTRRRAAAFWALTQAAPRNPSLVRSIVLPIYENTSEPLIVRIGAFVNILLSDPDLFVLRHIARSLIDEPSDQLVSYVSSFFRGILSSDFPCDRELAEKLRYVVPLWENRVRLSRPADITQSAVYMSSVYTPKFDAGSQTFVSVVRSEDSFLPNAVYISNHAYGAGNVYNVFALAFEGWGLDRLVNAFLGPQPGSTRNLWNVLGRRRFTRDASETNRKHIEQALPIADREYEPLYGRLSFWLFGNSVKLLQFDESLLAGIQSDAPPAAAFLQALGEEVHSKQFRLSEDLIVLVPTELGFPTYFDVKTAEFTYGNRPRLDFDHTEDGKFVVDFKRHYVHESRSYKMLGLALTFDRTGLGTGYDSRQLTSVPLELTLTLDPARRKLSVRRPLSLPIDLFSYHFVPYSFQLPYDRSSIEPPKLPGYPLYGNEELYHFDRTYFNDTLGFGLNFQGHVLKRDLEANLHEFLHEMSFNEQLQYLIINPRWSPRSFRMQALPAHHDATNVVELDLSHHLYKPEDENRETQFALEDAPTEGSQRPYTHAVLFNFAYKGDNSRERKISGELRYSFSKDLLRHKLLFFYDRAPFSASEQNHTKICLEASSKFPKPDPSKLAQVATMHRGKEVQAFMKLYYGSNCHDDSVIYFNGKYTHTDEDAKEIEAVASGAYESSKRPSRLGALYKKCMDGKAKGVHLGYGCVWYLYFTSRLGKLSLDVQYKNPRSLLPAPAQWLHEPTRQHDSPDDFLDAIAAHMTNSSGELHVESQVAAFQKTPFADVVVSDGAGNLLRRYHRVPTHTHLLEPRVFAGFGYSNMEEYSSYYIHPYCDVQGNTARTFDGVIVDLPQTDCFKVVARDCSVNRRFIVLAKALPNSEFRKALKVFIHHTEIEVLPEGDHAVVKVDGAPVSVPDDVGYSHVVQGAELFTVQRTFGQYQILSKSYGIDIFFDKKGVFIQVAHFYRGKVCGLCGDYNYDRHHELVGSNLHLFDNTLSFAKSYVVPSSDCTPPTH